MKIVHSKEYVPLETRFKLRKVLELCDMELEGATTPQLSHSLSSTSRQRAPI
jgi:hypothetical protein